MAKSRHLSLRQIEVLRRVGEAGSVLNASKLLGISGTAVAQAIADLEAELGEGTKLFERGRLTDAGALLVRLGGQLLDDESAARAKVVDLAKQVKGTTLLRIAYQPSLERLARPAFARLLEIYSTLRIEAIEAVSREIRRKVEHGDADVGVGYLPLPTEKRSALVTEDIIMQPLSFVGHKEHEASCSDAPVELKSLKDQPFALPWLRRETSPGALRMREVIEQYFALHRFTPRQVVFQGSTIASVLSIVRARKQVVTVLAGLDLLAENKKSLCVRPLLPKAPVQTIGLIWRKDEPRSKEAKDFAVDIKLRIKDAEERAAQSKDPPPSSPQEPWWQEGGGG